MRYQTANGCGAAAVVNTLRTFGVTISEFKARKVCGTTVDGTDIYGILSGLRSLGFSPQDYFGVCRKNAWLWLHGSLIHGRPVILCTDEWEHWVTTVGTLGNRVVLIDSERDQDNEAENGVHVMSSSKLMKRWRGGAENAPCRYYGISVGR